MALQSVLRRQTIKPKSFRGSSNLFATGAKHVYTPEQWEHVIKSAEDPVYFSENFIKIIGLDEGLITIPLRTYQKDIIWTAQNHRFLICECARQSGKTTAITAFVIWYALFHRNKRVAILANKADVAREIMNRIKIAYEYLPAWMKQGIVKWNESMMLFENGTRIMVAATSNASIRGFSNNVLIIDEAAHIENWEKFSTSVLPTVTSSKTGKVILISTVNGYNHFYKRTQEVRDGKSEYKLISVTWKDVPGRDEAWRRQELETLEGNEELFAQEYENRYLGSSGTLIAGWKLMQLGSGIHPIQAAEGISLYVRPEKDHQYIGVVDVSRGKLLDYSTLQILDITTMPYRQVLSYRDNRTTPADFAEVLNRMGRQYNDCPMLIEINDLGEQAAEVLYFDYEYMNVLFTEAAGKHKKITHLYTPNKTDRGVRTTKTIKQTGCSNFKLMLESGKIELADWATIQELATFCTNNKGSYSASKGKHDDLVMPLVLFAWLTTTDYFKELTDVNVQMSMKERTEEMLTRDLMPFGFISDTATIEEVEEIGGDVWFNVDGSIDKDFPVF